MGRGNNIEILFQFAYTFIYSENISNHVNVHSNKVRL